MRNVMKKKFSFLGLAGAVAAGFPPFDTSGASSEQEGVEFSMPDLLRKFFTSRLMLMIAVITVTHIF